MSRKQTFTGLNALGPRVRKLGVSFIATLIEPSTAASATTAFTGFLDGHAPGASRTCGGGGPRRYECGDRMW